VPIENFGEEGWLPSFGRRRRVGRGERARVEKSSWRVGDSIFLPWRHLPWRVGEVREGRLSRFELLLDLLDPIRKRLGLFYSWTLPARLVVFSDDGRRGLMLGGAVGGVGRGEGLGRRRGSTEGRGVSGVNRVGVRVSEGDPTFGLAVHARGHSVRSRSGTGSVDGGWPDRTIKQGDVLCESKELAATQKKIISKHFSKEQGELKET
jgi:hypothetical protein